MPSKKEFKVSEYIGLKLEEGKTNIYIKGELFRQCKFLLLNIPLDEISAFDETFEFSKRRLKACKSAKYFTIHTMKNKNQKVMILLQLSVRKPCQN